MCTLVLRSSKGLVAVSANRNELLSRPASGPRVEGGVLSPRDETAHGTWLGLNRHGLFVGITNRTGAVLDPLRRSRGLLVRDALEAASARALHGQLAAVPGDRYNGFHLVYADLEQAFVSIGTGENLLQHELAADAVHVVTERSYGAGAGERERTVRAAFEGLAPDVAAWRVPMTRHAALPLESACVHADAVGYGTRSSLQLLLRNRGRAAGLWTEGHPCVNAASDLGPLLAELLG
jgi:uncharacterized protein with NRDE domain